MQVGFLLALARRLSSVFRATILLGPIEGWPIAVMGLLVVLLPLFTLIVARPAIDPVGFALIVVAAVLGGISGGAIAEWESRQAPKVLAALAGVSLAEPDPVLIARSPSVALAASHFVEGSPPFLRDILVSVALVFNSPWASLRLGLGLSSFLQKDAVQRHAYVQLWSLDAALRYPLELLKVVLSFGVYGDAAVWDAIGYCGPVVDRYREADGRARLCPYYVGDATSRGVRVQDRFRCWDRAQQASGSSR